MEDRRPLKRLTVCVENKDKEDVVVIFTEPSLQELKLLVGEELIFTLVNDLLWNNKEEDKDEKGEVCIDEEEARNRGCKKEGIEENGGGKKEIIEENEDEKEEEKEWKRDVNEKIIEEINGGRKEEGIDENVDGKDEKFDGCIKEEEDMIGGDEEKGIENEEDLERKKGVLNGKELVGGLEVKKARRKGEELWLKMWGKEMERREMEREKEKREIEIQRSQFKTEFFGDLLVQSMDVDQDAYKNFDLEYPIKEEVKNQNEKKILPCDICGKFMSTVKSLRRHRKMHLKEIEKSVNNDDLDGSNSIFDNSFRPLMDIKTDNSTIKQEGQHSKEDKKKQTQKKEVQKEFPCEFCGKILKRRKTLNVHREMHTGRVPKECNICGKQSYGSYSYMVHMRTHTGERPHVCDICGNAFITTTQLTCHRRVHTGEKPYSCDVCKKDFRTLQDCKRHKITHTGEKPFSCDECGKLFTASKSLKEHKRSHSAEKLSYPCLVCGKEFTMIRNLRRHNKIHLGEKRKK